MYARKPHSSSVMPNIISHCSEKLAIKELDLGPAAMRDGDGEGEAVRLSVGRGEMQCSDVGKMICMIHKWDFMSFLVVFSAGLIYATLLCYGKLLGCFLAEIQKPSTDL